MKERVTLTIEEELLKKIDNSIDGSKIKNRSHAVELLLRKGLGNIKPQKAFILAGGKNNSGKSRSMVKIEGKAVLEHVIDLFKKHGINEIIISVSKKNQKIKKYFSDGSLWGVNIKYIEEEMPLGTGGPLNLAKEELKSTFVMCNADEIKDVDILDMFNFHKENEGLVTMALTTVKDPSDYGVVLMNGNKVMAFIEKPSKDISSRMINAGLYIIEPEIIKLLPEGYANLEQNVFPKLVRANKLIGYVFSGRWMDGKTVKNK
ncbi:hypothetical protein JW949_02760 [Candidatus Woesearchaeota archaeon]|nr:hypothetical protein [Candidatus Woesearchaeota archaeon]